MPLMDNVDWSVLVWCGEHGLPRTVANEEQLEARLDADPQGQVKRRRMGLAVRRTSGASPLAAG